MILLDGHSLNQRGLLEPETMALNLAERDSTATVTAGLDILSVSTGDWIKDNEDPGAGIVWRVKTVETQYDTETKTLQLEHLIRSLADKIINEEVTPETIAGEGAVYCSAYAAAEYILDRQSDWVLGDFDYTEVENPYTFDGDTLLAALETVSRSLEDPIWVYDFSSYPFTLHIRRRSENVTSEMRQGRNITTLKATVDRSRMYTRFYPVGKNNLRLDDPGYVAKNENIYGIVEKTETDQSMDTAEKLYAWAQERLNRHCEPQVTITISGADLSAATGESLDSFRIGDQCRVPLPDYGTTISEKIVKLQWRDKIKDRETVTITLANTLEDVQSILQKEKAAGSRGARGGAKMAEENETLIGDVYAGLYTRISQTAYEIRLEAHNEAESMRSIISQTAESIRISVENDRESLRTLIVQTASYIRTEAHNEAESIRSFVVQTASEIRGEVLDEANSLRSLVSQTASEIRGEVVDEAGSIRSLISQTASTIRGEVADEAGSLRSLVSQTASEIRGEVADEANSLRSLVTQTASEWSVRIEGVADSEGRVTAASIAAAINNQTGTSVVKLGADMVQIGNLSSDDLASWAADAASGRGVFAKFLTVRSLTAEELNTFLANIGDAEIDTIVSGSIESESVTIEDGLTAGSADIGSIETSSITVGEEVLNVADISISGNTMTITYVDGTTETFSKATALSAGTWSGGKFDVIASPQGETFSVGFVSGTDMRLDIGGNASGTPPLHTGSDYYIDYPIKVYQVTGDANPPTVHTATLLVDGTAAYSNGETQGKNAVGISDLAWEHDGDYFSNHHNSTNKISNNTTGRPTQITKDASINMTQDANWASDNTKWVYVRQGTSSTGQYVAGLEVNASSVRTAGKNDVGISDLAWEHDGDYFSNNHNSTNKISNNTTGRPTQITKDASINMTQDANWASDNTKWVYVRQGTSSTGQYVAGLEVNASSVRTAGKNDVGLSDLAWEHDGNYFTQNHNSTNKISNNTTGRPTQITKEASINMTQDANWDSNDQKWVYVRQGTSSSGDCIAGLQITAPNPKKLTSTGPALTYNGFHFPPAGYDGWSEVEVSIPMKTQEFTANTNGWVYPPSGYGGFDAIKVNVSGGGGGGSVTVTVDAIKYPSGIGTIIPIRAIKDGEVADTRYLYIENSGSYTYVTLDNWYTQEPTNAVGKSSRTGSISMPSNQISTTGSWVSGSYDPPSQLPSAINRAKSDGDWCYFTVSCSCGASKRYQFML